MMEVGSRLKGMLEKESHVRLLVRTRIQAPGGSFWEKNHPRPKRRQKDRGCLLMSSYTTV